MDKIVFQILNILVILIELINSNNNHHHQDAVADLGFFKGGTFLGKNNFLRASEVV
jgi:hypothetical protein